MTAYYNENDPYAAEWLRNLIAAGHIAPGDVDDRSIKDVRPDDLIGYTQAHFFAGIGGWSYALRVAGWPDDRPVWTGSCPCQPFSAAGKRGGFSDERHLWPDWFRLIRECRPAVLFGEQVARATVWLDAVLADLEAEDYACGAAVLPAASVDAPHIRQRCWFVADASGAGAGRDAGDGACAEDQGEGARSSDRLDASNPLIARGAARELVDAAGEQVGLPRRARQPRVTHWSDAEFLPCTDGKARPVEPGTFPLAHGIPGRVGRLRAYGNAIVPQVAAEFIRATY